MSAYTALTDEQRRDLLSMFDEANDDPVSQGAMFGAAAAAMGIEEFHVIELNEDMGRVRVKHEGLELESEWVVVDPRDSTPREAAEKALSQVIEQFKEKLEP